MGRDLYKVGDLVVIDVSLRGLLMTTVERKVDESVPNRDYEEVCLIVFTNRSEGSWSGGLGLTDSGEIEEVWWDRFPRDLCQDDLTWDLPWDRNV